jgi:hypothetical protein
VPGADATFCCEQSHLCVVGDLTGAAGEILDAVLLKAIADLCEEVELYWAAKGVSTRSA